jgi:hypothetical protein
MELSRILVSGVVLILCQALVLPAWSQAPFSNLPTSNSPDYQLLANPGVEIYDPAYTQYQDVDCQVASDWERFWYSAPEPYWMDTRVFANSHLGGDWVESIEGETSQLLLATEPYTAGIRQQVTGLTPGVGYGFHAAMLTIYQSSAQPPVHGTMIKQVGMDPTGGTDAEAPTVVWGEPNDRDKEWDIDSRTAVYAESSTMTVFIRVQSLQPAGPWPFLNLSFLDSAILARTPMVTATSPAVSEAPTFTVNWDNAVVAPGGGKLKWRDVQWLDEAEGVWRDWMTRTNDLAASFVGERGHAYRFRARAWQRYPNGAHLYGPYRPEGDTRTQVAGSELTGRVLINEEHPVRGATVAISGTNLSDVSSSDGYYEMTFPPISGPQTITVAHPNWLAPAPVHGVTFGPTETVSLTWTLRPPDDAVVNGEFESELDGWSPISSQGITPRAVTEPVHTGQYALALSHTVGVSQSVVLAGAWEPALSFWYRPVTTDTGDVFNVILTVVTQTVTPALSASTTRILTPSLEAGGWRHFWYSPGRPDAYLTGTVTMHFQMYDDGDQAATTVCLDEVSLGSTPGGPYKVYLPLATR